MPDEPVPEAVAKAIREGKVVVAMSRADDVWTDPMTGTKYLREPFKLDAKALGAVMWNPMPGAEVHIFEYQVPSEFSLQFIPQFGPHHLSTGLKAPPSYRVRVEVWDAFYRSFRGTIWDGTTTELCLSEEMRSNGFPLCYNGDGVVVAEPGDWVVVVLLTPHGSPAPVIVGDDRKPLVDFVLRCFKLVPAEVKKDG